MNCKKLKVFTLSRVKTLFKLINSHWWFHWHSWRRAGLSVSVQTAIYENTMEYHVKENYLKHWNIITLSEYEKVNILKTFFFLNVKNHKSTNWKCLCAASRKYQVPILYLVLQLDNTSSDKCGQKLQLDKGIDVHSRRH